MLETINLGKWELKVDVELTKEQYKKTWNLCECEDCKNYYKATQQVSPQVQGFFKDLGINPSVINHLSCFGDIKENGLHYYIGSYHLVGTLKEQDVAFLSNQTEPYTYKLDENWEISFTTDLEFVPGFFPSPVIQMDVDVYIPWVLK
ncbi:hypothetical protein U8V72_21065 [Priestia filamentosa]|uniref:hypothetical protein n=1 Tax=Priestia filamentosa TaxID=1402861 RepID=UPI00397A4039